MVSADISILEGVLTTTEPLGPVDQALITEDDVAESLLNEEVMPFKGVSSNPYMLLLGRRGSGKSAILEEIRLNLQPSLGGMQNDVRLPKKGEPFIIPVLAWRDFDVIRQNVIAVMRKYQVDNQVDNPLADLVPSERYTSLWYKMLWVGIINHFFDYCHLSEAKADLKPVKNYKNYVDAHTTLEGSAEREGKGFFDAARRSILDFLKQRKSQHDYVDAHTTLEGSVEREEKGLFDAARRSILDFLKQRKSHLYFLFDSMENYPVRNDVFPRVLTGLFRSLKSINAESQYIHISFCIPEEIESFLIRSSANPLKDFASVYRIRWSPIDLLSIVAHRFRLAMAIHDDEFYEEIKDLDFSNREHVHRLFSRILPNPTKNTLGDPEDPLAYIIRHTQLLPRHVLAIFNAILSINYRSTGSFRRVDKLAIQKGITDVEETLAGQILHPYDNLYPRLFAACKQILPDLNPICSFGALMKNERRFKGLIEPDISSVWHTLFEMGMLGRVVEPSLDGSLPVFHSRRYRYGEFHYNKGRAFGMATNSEYCFHPVFSRALGIHRQKGDKRVVYPAHIEMITLAS